MAVRTGLKENLQEITALIGLLRSDLIELSEAPLRRGATSTVVSHMHWIADRFDELGPALSSGLDRRSPPPTKTGRRRPTAHGSRPAGKARTAQTHAQAPTPLASTPDNRGKNNPDQAKSAQGKSGQGKPVQDNPGNDNAGLGNPNLAKPSTNMPDDATTRPNPAEVERPDAAGPGPGRRDES